MPKFKKHILEMSPYKPPLEGRASQGYLLLDFNEMTVEPGNEVRKALHEFIDSKRVQVYPEYGDLQEVIATYAGCNPEEILATNGSDQAIDVVVRAVVEKGDKVVIPSPSFAMHYQAALLEGAEIVNIRYNENDLSFPFQEVMEVLREDIKLLILCNPNNPLGTVISSDQVKSMLGKAKEHDVAVLHDEAYFEFSGITAKELVSEFPNLFVTRTLSKQFGIASLRIGYVISQKENIEQLLKIRGPYDVNMAAAIAAKAALLNPEYSKTYIKEVMQEAKGKVEQFLRDHGIEFFPGEANFLLVRPKDSQRVLEGLRSQGILVRPREDPKGTLRITIGTLKDTEQFIKALEKALKMDT